MIYYVVLGSFKGGKWSHVHAEDSLFQWNAGDPMAVTLDYSTVVGWITSWQKVHINMDYWCIAIDERELEI